MAATRDWDAKAYQRVSVPHEEWARSVLDRLGLEGDERVLDAGCGSGRVTAMLIERLPRGSVVAVDGSQAMIAEVASVLRPERDEALLADLTELALERPVDAVFSSAVFHWVLDHERLFAALRRALRPGGRLAAQCGGAGNIEALRRTADGLTAEQPFAPYFEGFVQPWNYAGAEQTEARLRDAGFVEAEAWLRPWEVVPPEPAEFLRAVCLGPHVDRLPGELGERFVAEVLARESEPLTLDYVRLNIAATA